MSDHRVRWCDPWCGREECVHRDKMWDRRDPWNRSTAEIYNRANSPAFKFWFNVMIAAFVLLVICASLT